MRKISQRTSVSPADSHSSEVSGRAEFLKESKELRKAALRAAKANQESRALIRQTLRVASAEKLQLSEFQKATARLIDAMDVELDASNISRPEISKGVQQSAPNIDANEELLRYNGSMGIFDFDICSRIIRALASDETLAIRASEIPLAGLSEESQTILARRWADDIARVKGGLSLELSEGGQPLRLPDAIPDDQKYKPRQGIVEFLEKGWPAPYIKAGLLSRPDFRRLDDKGDMALRNWLRENELPEHLRMPTRSEVVDQAVADPEELRRAWRLAAAHARRQGQGNQR